MDASAVLKRKRVPSSLRMIELTIVVLHPESENLHIFTDDHVQDVEKVTALKQEIENFMMVRAHSHVNHLT